VVGNPVGIGRCQILVQVRELGGHFNRVAEAPMVGEEPGRWSTCGASASSQSAGASWAAAK
jgi:hypothetical protein